MMKMKSASIRPFTLLELILVIGLLSTIGSFFVLRIASHLQERKYRVEEEIVAARCQLGERIATLCDTNIVAHATGQSYILSSGGKAPEGFRAVMERPIHLKSGYAPKDETYSPYGRSANCKPKYPDEVEASLHPH